jgi:hypothetical protein
MVEAKLEAGFIQYGVKFEAGFRKVKKMGCLRIYGGPVSMVGRV